MCKTPANNCQPVKGENPDPEPAEEDNTISEDELERNSGSSFCTDTSLDEEEEGSDSDAESASGNRVTPDMVVWYMLREQGIITEEQYAEKKDMSDEYIKPLVPKIPRSELSDEDSSRDESGSLDFNFDPDPNSYKSQLERVLEALFDKKEEKLEDSKSEEIGNNENVEKEKDACKDIEDYTVSNGRENNTQEDTGQEQTNKEMVIPINYTIPKEVNEPMNTLQEHQVAIETNQKESNEEKNPVTCENVTMSENINETVNEESGDTSEPKSECIDKNSTKTGTMLESQAQGGDVAMKVINNQLEDDNAETEKKTTETEKPKQDTVLMDIVDANDKSTSADLETETEFNGTRKETKSFQYILKKLVKEKRISTDYAYDNILETYVKSLDKHYKKNKAVALFSTPTEELKEFASFLHFFSPSSYKYITETFNTPLIEQKKLWSWYLKDDDEPGFSEKAFNILKQRASGRRLPCVLMSRDIFLRNWGFDCDRLDYGGGCNSEYSDKAVIAFVFVLVSLDEDWKIPIGYVFAREVPEESQAGMINLCLSYCHEAGADVVAVTLETPTPAEFLGCSFQDLENLKTTFKHPACDREVAVWIDPCLALRSARHTLKAKEVLRDATGDTIRWNLIRKLIQLHADDSIEFTKPEFLKLRNHIAKAGLTTEIFSDSLSPALELCEDLLPFVFRDTAATRKYIETINSLYDILNSKTITNRNDVELQLNAAKEYLMGFFRNQENSLSHFDKENLAADKRLKYRSFMDGKPVCGFIGFMICIESFKHLYSTLVEKEQRLNGLNTHRLCKDHAEDFVKSVRAYERIDSNNFRGFNFQCYCDRLFDILEKKPNFSDQNVPLEQWPLKNKYPPAVTIKLTSGKRVYDEVYSHQYVPKKLPKTEDEDRATKMVREYSKAMDSERDLASRKNMVGYLAGWIASKLARRVKCEECVDALQTDRKLWFHKFITSKDIRGLCLPSEELFRICWECERALKLQGSVLRLKAWVLRRLQTRFPWADRRARHHPQHYIHLVRAVIAKYIPLRISAPFSAKQTKKIQAMFRLFSCISQIRERFV